MSGLTMDENTGGRTPLPTAMESEKLMEPDIPAAVALLTRSNAMDLAEMLGVKRAEESSA